MKDASHSPSSSYPIDLLRQVRHDTRAPLATAKSYCQAMLKTNEAQLTGEQFQTSLQQIYSCLERVDLAIEASISAIERE